MRTAFVTGGTGFIGRHLVDRLVSRGVEVRCLVRSRSRAGHLAGDGVHLVDGSLADVAAWRPGLEGCDTVFHLGGLCAARSRGELFEINGEATGRLADACAAGDSPPVLVYVSSLAAAGPPPPGRPVRVEDDPFGPISNYGSSKLAGETALRRRAGRLPITIVQPGIVFGPHDDKMMTLYRMISRMGLHLPMGFRPVPLSLIHVDDLVSLLLAAGERGERLAAGEGAGHDARGVYHACDDREHPTYGVLGAKVARGLGRGLAVVPLPALPVYPVVAAVEWFWNLRGQASIISPDKLREATARSWAASAAKARRGLAFAPAATLDERLRETGDWFRSNGLL
jgi:dihydroflavonol-4-reductase